MKSESKETFVENMMRFRLIRLMIMGRWVAEQKGVFVV